MSGWYYNMNSKSLVISADWLMADKALLIYSYYNTTTKTREIMVHVEATIGIEL